MRSGAFVVPGTRQPRDVCRMFHVNPDPIDCNAVFASGDTGAVDGGCARRTELVHGCARRRSWIRAQDRIARRDHRLPTNVAMCVRTRMRCIGAGRRRRLVCPASARGVPHPFLSPGGSPESFGVRRGGDGRRFLPSPTSECPIMLWCNGFGDPSRQNLVVRDESAGSPGNHIQPPWLISSL